MANDHAALRAACKAGTGLCTIVGVEGSFSRRLGAQLAVATDGNVTGSLADGCLEKQLAREVLDGGERRIMRFGAGSEMIDFRLPCGSGLDILIDPDPDMEACRSAVKTLDDRKPASLHLPLEDRHRLAHRNYIPALELVLFGEGPELDALSTLAAASGFGVTTHAKDGSGLALGRAPDLPRPDRWRAIVLLFHDHEWEQAILEWALQSPAFYIGAQGGRTARDGRVDRLFEAGFDASEIARVTSPVGLTRHSREPASLAISALAQIVGAYDEVHPHHDVG